MAVSSDQFHDIAVKLADQMESQRTRLVTTQAVVLEIGNALSKERYRAAAARLLTALVADPRVEIVPLSADLLLRAFELYATRDDKEWGLTDCVSFIVMQDRSLTESLTADEHFRQAGFQPLLC